MRTGHIREDASIFGQIFFADADTEMYDPQQEKMVPVHVDAKTIVADPEVFLLRNLGALNNTIIHECVHWDTVIPEGSRNSTLSHFAGRVLKRYGNTDEAYNDYITRKLDELGITVSFRKRKFDHFVWYKNR